MFGIEWLLAAFLLQGSDLAALPDQDPVAKWFPFVNKALQQTALSWEILDQRELRYVLVRQDEFLVDVRMLQRRQRDLYDAPPIQDAQRLPDKGMVNEFLQFNRAYRQHLDSCLLLYPNSASLKAAREEVEQLYLIWDAVRDARCDYYHIHIRRQALKKLRDILGNDDYQQTNLPPHVPVWRFECLK
jgi:hypothetical protein